MSDQGQPPTDAEISSLVRRLVRQAVREELQGTKFRRSVPAATASVLLPKDVAQRWHCSERHVRNMVNDGRLPGLRIGGKLLRIRLEDVEHYEREMEREDALQPEPEPPGKKAVMDPVTRLSLARIRKGLP